MTAPNESPFDSDTTTLLGAIQAQLQTASTWITGPRSAVLATLAGQLNELLAGVSATDILGGTVTQVAATPDVANAPAPDAVSVPALPNAGLAPDQQDDSQPSTDGEPGVPANVAPPAS